QYPPPDLSLLRSSLSSSFLFEMFKELFVKNEKLQKLIAVGGSAEKLEQAPANDLTDETDEHDENGLCRPLRFYNIHTSFLYGDIDFQGAFVELFTCYSIGVRVISEPHLLAKFWTEDVVVNAKKVISRSAQETQASSPTPTSTAPGQASAAEEEKTAAVDDNRVATRIVAIGSTPPKNLARNLWDLNTWARATHSPMSTTARTTEKLQEIIGKSMEGSDDQSATSIARAVEAEVTELFVYSNGRKTGRPSDPMNNPYFSQDFHQYKEELEKQNVDRHAGIVPLLAHTINGVVKTGLDGAQKFLKTGEQTNVERGYKTKFAPVQNFLCRKVFKGQEVGIKYSNVRMLSWVSLFLSVFFPGVAVDAAIRHLYNQWKVKQVFTNGFDKLRMYLEDPFGLMKEKAASFEIKGDAQGQVPRFVQMISVDVANDVHDAALLKHVRGRLSTLLNEHVKIDLEKLPTHADWSANWYLFGELPVSLIAVLDNQKL
ncbi:unnamed protein product, partial [Amoebophrya sp. A25]